MHLAVLQGDITKQKQGQEGQGPTARPKDEE
jgi:hypothetical protein